MRRRLISDLSYRTICIGVIAAALAACATSGAGNGSGGGGLSTASISRSDESSIRATLDSSAIGWNRGDLDIYVSIYTDDIVSRSANGFITGKEAARQVMRQGYWKTGRPIQVLHYEHQDIRGLGADYAVMTGEYALTGGGQSDHTGWFTTIWRRTATGWRCMHDHSS